MKRRKKALKFKKIRIANVNFIKGGDDTDTSVSVIVACQSGINCPPPNEASVDANPCSDACLSRGFEDHSNQQNICLRETGCAFIL